MTWTRLEGRYPTSRKVRPLSDGAFRADVEGMCWSNEEGTDGRIATDELQLIGDAKRKPKHAAELVRRGRWHPAGDPPCPSPRCPHDGTAPDGWTIHDFLDYNPTAAEVARERQAKKERQKRWRDKRSGRFSSVDASRDGSRDGYPDESRDGPATGYETPPRTAPPRSEGSGGGAPPSGPDGPEPPPAAADAGGAAGGRPTPPAPPGKPDPAQLADTRRALATATAKHRADAARRADPLAELDAAARVHQPIDTDEETPDAA